MRSRNSSRWGMFVAGMVLLLPGVSNAGTSPAVSTPAAPIEPGDAPLGPVPNWIDHFDLYATGSQMDGQGGWAQWTGSTGAGALTSSDFARSAANSVDVFGATDLVHTYNVTTGTWTYTAWQYIESAFTGNSYFILLNTYPPAAGSNSWSVQLCFDATNNVVRDDIPGNCTGTPTAALVRDQWVEIRVVIRLDTDQADVFYNGTLLYTGAWSSHLSAGGQVRIHAVDLFANTAASVYYDDLSLSNLPYSDGFEDGDSRNWHETVSD